MLSTEARICHRPSHRPSRHDPIDAGTPRSKFDGLSNWFSRSVLPSHFGFGHRAFTVAAIFALATALPFRGLFNSASALLPLILAPRGNSDASGVGTSPFLRPTRRRAAVGKGDKELVWLLASRENLISRRSRYRAQAGGGVLGLQKRAEAAP
jgi:hypothetical protein